MGSPFKMNPKTPFMKALVGKQGNLPEHLKKAILDAPAKKTDKQFEKRQGSKETKDVGVTYYGTKGSLASGDGPSANQPSASGDVFASSRKRGGRTSPSTQSFKEAREREAMEDRYDAEQKKKQGSKSPAKMTTDPTKKGKGKAKGKMETYTEATARYKKEGLSKAAKEKSRKKAAERRKRLGIKKA